MISKKELKERAERQSFYPWPSPIGELILVCSSLGLTEIVFADAESDWYSRLSTFADEDQRPLNSVIKALRSYFYNKTDKGLRRLVIDIHGTPFQRAVWEQVLAIPYGTTKTYGNIAEAVGYPLAARAVGRAVGSNPIPIVIPCHRVIGTNGRLVGFSSGIDKKRTLLEREGLSFS